MHKVTLPSLPQLLLVGAITFAGTAVLEAATTVSYSAIGSTCSQDFNTLPIGTNGSTAPWNDAVVAGADTLTGWSLVGGTNANPTSLTIIEGSLSNQQGKFFSAGAASSTDRTLATQSLDTAGTFQRIGLGLTNDSGSVLSGFTLGYTGEQWRAVSLDDADTLTFEYQIFNVGIADPLEVTTGWIPITSLNFTSPVFNVTNSTSLDGNLPANRAILTGSVESGLAWGSGQELWLRWTDSHPAGGDQNRQVMGVDDLSFSSVPEPTTAVLAGIALCGLLGVRRRR